MMVNPITVLPAEARVRPLPLVIWLPSRVMRPSPLIVVLPKVRFGSAAPVEVAPMLIVPFKEVSKTMCCLPPVAWFAKVIASRKLPVPLSSRLVTVYSVGALKNAPSPTVHSESCVIPVRVTVVEVLLVRPVVHVVPPSCRASSALDGVMPPSPIGTVKSTVYPPPVGVMSKWNPVESSPP